MKYFLTAQAILTDGKLSDVSSPNPFQSYASPWPQVTQPLPTQQYQQPQPPYQQPQSRLYPAVQNAVVVHPINPSARGGEIGTRSFLAALNQWRVAAYQNGNVGGIRIESQVTLARLLADISISNDVELKQVSVNADKVTYNLFEGDKIILSLLVNKYQTGAVFYFNHPSEFIDLTADNISIAVSNGSLADYPDWFFINDGLTPEIFNIAKEEPTLGDLVQEAGEQAKADPLTVEDLQQKPVPADELPKQEQAEKPDDPEPEHKPVSPVDSVQVTDEASETNLEDEAPIYVVMGWGDSLAAVKVNAPSKVRSYINTLKNHAITDPSSSVVVLTEDFVGISVSGRSDLTSLDNTVANRRYVREAVKHMVQNPSVFNTVTGNEHWIAGGVSVVDTSVLTKKQIDALGKEAIEAFDKTIDEVMPK